ncbi:hypothetical protein AVEN_189943-1 [Araneus ventricosus]|uniref:Uncharacterized protein n=1 Tax=Araneus ventricosus TaxID=182803 RepID=A0A4Y2F0Y8_ARAVE|nr:hypothetical protein AVEN_189943-1 [Araneus ventricosus]
MLRIGKFPDKLYKSIINTSILGSACNANDLSSGFSTVAAVLTSVVLFVQFSLSHVCDTVTKIVLWVYGRNSPTRRIMENEGLFTNMQGKHVAQVTGTIPLIQISNTNRQQFTSNNSNSTFNRAQLTGFPARTADKTPKLFQSINTQVIQAQSFHTLPDRS